MLRHHIMAVTMRITNLPGLMEVPCRAPLFNLLALFAVLISSSVAAHDPGLSQVDLQLQQNKVTAHLTFSKTDIASLIELDSDMDGAVSDAELDQATPALKQWLQQAFQLSVADKDLTGKHINIQQDDSNALHFRLHYPINQGEQLVLRSPMLDTLPLGHRQFVKVRVEDAIVNTRILSARTSLMTLDIPKNRGWALLLEFIGEGIWHIWIGYDHILFLFTLLLPAVLLKSNQQEQTIKHLLWHTGKVVTAFTVAHSLTLALSIFDIISLPGQWVESLIALSVIIAACNNIFNWLNRELWLMAFLFGLIHGLGFASVLTELGLQDNQLLALLGFNAGVEIGQLAIILVCLPLLSAVKSEQYYRPLILRNGSWVIVAMASVWLVERITDSSLHQLFI